jgi:hypothetical protein
MASKKLKKAAQIAAGIGAAYLASQALGKKKPISAQAKGLKITRAKKFGESDEGQIARLDAAQQRGLDITRSKPFEPSDEATPEIYKNVPGVKFLTTPGGISDRTPEQVMEQMEGFGPMAKKGKFIVKKAKLGMFGKVETELFPENRGTGERITEEDIKESLAPYLAAKNKMGDRLTKSDIRYAKDALKRGYPKPDITATEGSFVRGGSVIARGNKLARSKPTKLF